MGKQASKEELVIDLFIACPVGHDSCDNKPSFWQHKTCRGRTRVRGDGFLLCAKCKTKAELLDWNYKCSAHDYEPVFGTKYYAALSTMANLEGVDPEWAFHLIERLQEQFTKRK